jgi:putative transposase
MDETYIKVGGRWKYLYRAVDRDGETVDFLLTARRDEAAARRFLERAIDLHGRPETMGLSGFPCLLGWLNIARRRLV